MSGPLEEMTEEELLDLAGRALVRAVQNPVGSVGRSVQLGVYDKYSAELRRRVVAFMSRKAF